MTCLGADAWIAEVRYHKVKRWTPLGWDHGTATQTRLKTLQHKQGSSQALAFRKGQSEILSTFFVSRQGAFITSLSSVTRAGYSASRFNLQSERRHERRDSTTCENRDGRRENAAATSASESASSKGAASESAEWKLHGGRSDVGRGKGQGQGWGGAREQYR